MEPNQQANKNNPPPNIFSRTTGMLFPTPGQSKEQQQKDF